MTAPVDAARLRRILDQLDDADRVVLLAAFDRRVASRLRLVERDQLLAVVASQHFANVTSRSEQARQIATALDRYCASGWRHDRDRSACPYPGDTLRAALWRLLAFSNGRPLGHDRIRALIAQGRCSQSTYRTTIEEGDPRTGSFQ